MERIIKVPYLILNKSTALFNTYIYLIANRYKKSKYICLTYETLANQMGIDQKYVKTYLSKLARLGFIQISEPNIKKNGKTGALTFTLLSKPGEKYVILPLSLMLDKDIPKTYKQYYANFKRIIDLKNFTTFKSPDALQLQLSCKPRTYFEFMKFMKTTVREIDQQQVPLLLDQSTAKEYKYILSYEKELFIQRTRSK